MPLHHMKYPQKNIVISFLITDKKLPIHLINSQTNMSIMNDKYIKKYVRTNIIPFHEIIKIKVLSKIKVLNLLALS